MLSQCRPHQYRQGDWHLKGIKTLPDWLPFVSQCCAVLTAVSVSPHHIIWDTSCWFLKRRINSNCKLEQSTVRGHAQKTEIACSNVWQWRQTLLIFCSVYTTSAQTMDRGKSSSIVMRPRAPWPKNRDLICMASRPLWYPPILLYKWQ